MKDRDALTGCLLVIVALALVILGVAAVTFVFMWAWNGFAVIAFGLPALDLGTAFVGIVFLSIVGSFFRSIPRVSRS